MSIASSSSQVDDPATYKVYRQYKDKSEDDWDGDVFQHKTLPEEIQIQIHGGADVHQPPPPPPPPYIVLVQGPPNVGKSLLIKSLVKHFTGETRNDIRAPITVITDNKRRLQFVECPDDIDGMIDAAKYADLVLFLVDASYGFEAETFEFLNLLQAHGFPPVMGVLTHLDEFKDEKERKETIERLQDHFHTEIYQGARLSCLSGPCHNMHTYQTVELQELAENILMLQSHSSSWRAAHPYVLVDRIEDVTPLEKVHEDAHCKRNISLYGYLRGCNIKSRAKVHLAGAGDFRLADVRTTTDPFPLASEMEKQKDFVELTDLENLENESFSRGTYLRLEVHDVPCHVVQNFDPSRPILVGGIGPEEEENDGYMQARLRRHKWHMKLLKSADPVTVSAGWRRYQTKPIYATAFASDNERYKIRDGSPEHEDCVAMFWGPLAPPGTRIAVVHGTKEVFRIAAKAVVLDPEDHVRILKVYKRKGKLQEILEGGNALVKFKPWKIDVAKFKGQPIRTRWFANWGEVKKVVSKENGTARCKFEKRVRENDTFILPVFCQVGAPLCEPCYSTKDTFNEVEKRRRVEIIDGEPCSLPDISYHRLLLNIPCKDTVVVMSEERRLELIKKLQKEKFKKISENGVSWGDDGEDE